jgi:hypothetical protein
VTGFLINPFVNYFKFLIYATLLTAPWKKKIMNALDFKMLFVVIHYIIFWEIFGEDEKGPFLLD